MTRPLVWDAFMFNDELDMLECRLTELDCAVDRFVLVEANVTHQDRPKPFHYLENQERFSAWADRIVHVQAKGLPPRTFDPDPWAREHAQREFIGKALVDADPDDILLQSDVDEIPTVIAARNVRPSGHVAFTQRLHCFAVDWLHPHPWKGTVAGRVGKIVSFGQMRDVRNTAPSIPGAGWHLSWMGGADATLAKLGSFCHPEIAGRTLDGLQRDTFMAQGFHVDGVKMLPVEVDDTFPKWIRDGHAPTSWYRPRDVDPSGWTPPSGLGPGPGPGP